MKTVNLQISELFDRAYAVFQANMGLCIGMWFVYGLCNGQSNSSSVSGTGDEDLDMIILIVVLFFALISFFLGPPIKAGFQLSYLRMIRDDSTVSFSNLFDGFSVYFRLLFLTILLGIGGLVGMCFCVVPGIIFMLGTWPAYLLVMEDDLDAVSAVKVAWDLTDGHKMDLFVLGLASFALQIVGLLLCCIGVYATGPIAELMWVAAYDELRQGKGLSLDKTTT